MYKLPFGHDKAVLWNFKLMMQARELVFSVTVE